MSKFNQVLTCKSYQPVCRAHPTGPFFQEGVWGNLAFSKKVGVPQILFWASLWRGCPQILCFASLQFPIGAPAYGAVRLSLPSAPFSLPDNPRVI